MGSGQVSVVACRSRGRMGHDGLNAQTLPRVLVQITGVGRWYSYSFAVVGLCRIDKYRKLNVENVLEERMRSGC